MLMPSTITALRTRRYDSTRYIPGTIHGSRMTLWMAEDGTIFNRHLSAIYPPTWSNLTPPITVGFVALKALFYDVPKTLDETISRPYTGLRTTRNNSEALQDNPSWNVPASAKFGGKR